MKTVQADVAIIGAGTAGLNARRAAERNGASAIMVDPGPLGTTCARVGCMPSKLLIAASEAAWHAREAGIFGVDCEVSVDGRRVMDRVQRERDRFAGFVVSACDDHREKGRLIDGRATVLDAHTLRITDAEGTETHRLGFRSLVVATGSKNFVPPPYRGLGPDVVLTNESVFEVEDLPRSVLVVGTGVIALELGQALHRLGVRVTIVGILGLIGPLSDPKLLEVAGEVFGEELDLHADYDLQSVEQTAEGVTVRFRDPDGSEHSGTYDKVLMAAGRVPDLRPLGLDGAGIELDERGRLVAGFDPHTMQVGDSHVFLAGDVTGDRPLLHEAADEGQIAGENAALFPEVGEMPRRTPLGVVFSEPQIGLVGRMHRDLDPERHRTGAIDYSDQGRSRMMHQNKGWVHVYGEAGTGLLVGAEMLGPRVEHTAHLLAWAIQGGLTVHEALKMPFYHPVIEEGIRTALRDLRSKI